MFKFFRFENVRKYKDVNNNDVITNLMKKLMNDFVR